MLLVFCNGASFNIASIKMNTERVMLYVLGTNFSVGIYCSSCLIHHTLSDLMNDNIMLT